jgi:hypothetical protein
MPNVWAHFIFGQQVLERLGEMIFCQDEHCKNMFNLGCQGPDFLFYHRFLPWQRSKALNQMGTEMHNRHCGPVIMTLLDAVQGRDAGSRKPDDAVVYALGFVLHHILDRHVHPYVFSKSGFRKWDHQRFEIMIDTLIAAELWKVDTTKTPAWKHMPLKRLRARSTLGWLRLSTATNGMKRNAISRRRSVCFTIRLGSAASLRLDKLSHSSSRRCPTKWIY